MTSLSARERSTTNILQGKTILVTGATDGIGRQTALRLAGMGARLLLHDNDHQRLEDTRQQIRQVTGNDNLTLTTYLLNPSPLTS
jgi:NAD(P)-dependent dehydrogenase (short-subunit alcohol dehydrogenase family)